VENFFFIIIIHKTYNYEQYLVCAGVDIKIVQEMVENHLKSMIMKHFDPKKADSIFTDEGEVRAIARILNRICK
jgi:hypothetical protein